MSKLTAKKIGVTFAIVAFTILVFGSLIAGTRLLSALARGFEGAVVFGLLAWLMCGLFKEQKEAVPPPPVEKVENKGENVDQTA